MFKISIAMATYNGEKYIVKQLNSILNQTRLPDEVIIVDDCSTDKTADIIKDYISEKALDNWKFSENETNLGFKANFKKAISLAKGDICFLCDQDDIWDCEKIKTVESVFSDEKVIGVSTGFCVIDAFDNDITEKHLKKDIFAFGEKPFKETLNNISIEEIMHRNISPGCTCAYRKSAIDIFLKNCDINLPHDYQLSAISAVLSGFYYYNVPLNSYRIHDENALGVKPLEQTREEIAKEKLRLSRVLAEVNSKGERLNSLCIKRYNAIKNKKPFSALSLWTVPEYRKYYSFKERVGDVLYAFRK